MTDSAEEMDEFLEIYLEESKEETEKLVELLLQLERTPDDAETLREAFRLLHTFKGSTGMMGFDRINGLAHELETRFDACRNGRERLTTETVSVTLRCVDFFRNFLARLDDGNDDQGDPQPLIDQLADVPVTFAEPKIAEVAPSDEPVVSETTAGDRSASDPSTATKLEQEPKPEQGPEQGPEPESEPESEPRVGVGAGVGAESRSRSRTKSRSRSARLWSQPRHAKGLVRFTRSRSASDCPIGWSYPN